MSQQSDHFTSVPDDQFKKRLKQTAEQSDKELDEILMQLNWDIGGTKNPNIPVKRAKSHLNALMEKKVREAVTKELERLDGAIEILDLYEADLQKMKTWVKNAKWSVIAPPGRNMSSGEKLQDNQAKEGV